ncbi:MAG: hypothetical protein JRF43_06805 [Deltaproteobacteria bacterium]|nr:hypothetical protein [Deltaproteobacteria bacterium]
MREHNELCDRRAIQKTDKKTIKMGKLFIADSMRAGRAILGLPALLRMWELVFVAFSRDGIALNAIQNTERSNYYDETGFL